ncbi:Gldg family protein, partial [Candidatus Hydrogenedentota bacterium]
MKSISTVFKRDFFAYFTSPIGYIFIVVFLLISVGLYMTPFFTYPSADMRAFFGNLPLLLCVFIPAVTMRVWAEERKENTWEMLLTFPMRARELVLGKFLAALAFFGLTLGATLTVPLMLACLGNPDTGGVVGGYVGTFLLGAFFLAIGIFFSGFFKDQIVAFVVTLLACFAIFLLGTQFISAYIDGVCSGLGTLLAQLVGVTDHYYAFTRGVLELADVLYFIGWTALFLLLNIYFIDGRSRPGARLIFGSAVALCLTIGLLFNWLLTGQSMGRIDMTEDKIYTVSGASKNILSKLDVPVQVKLYITPKEKMPTAWKQLEADISDKIDELRVAGKGKLDFKVIHMEAANVFQGDDEKDEDDDDEVEAIEKRMYDKGVKPFSVQALSQDEMTNKLVYSSIGVGYREKAEEIIPQIQPASLRDLEYALVNVIFKLTREEKPVVALVAPKEAIKIPEYMKQMYAQMGQPMPTTEDPYEMLERILDYEKYDVRRVELTVESKLPEDYDTLVVINPRDLNDRQRWEINRAL